MALVLIKCTGEPNTLQTLEALMENEGMGGTQWKMIAHSLFNNSVFEI